ncbi:hypothetical protein ACFYMO_27060 [Streptomyces sp. NPDC007025]|uniref:hypothetical protein n=1 Tax=Streptomyces sp. NPDC007025 TaxID=3364771 RepID=UPI0036BFABB2
MSEFAQGPGPGRVPEQQPPGSATERYDETVRPDQPHGHPGQAPADRPEDPGVRRGPGLPEPADAREPEAAPGGDEEPRAEPEEAVGRVPGPDGGPVGSGPEPEEEPEDGPRPLGVGVRPTGNGPVDARLKRLEDADHLAVSGHLEVYEDVHDGLRESLAALDRPHTPRS